MKYVLLKCASEVTILGEAANSNPAEAGSEPLSLSRNYSVLSLGFTQLTLLIAGMIEWLVICCKNNAFLL